MIKFIYSEKATHFCKISTVDLTYIVTVKSTVEISQNFVAFSEYMNFKYIKESYDQTNLFQYFYTMFGKKYIASSCSTKTAV